MTGTLYVVATPIGNLEDITLRALRVLREAEVVACEDTRQTRKLLTRHTIQARLVSCHKFNERARTASLLRLLEEGKQVALVSDGGTPALSDPGVLLVEAAARAGHRVVPVPGPSALVASVSAAGLSAGRVTFFGFLPARAADRRRFLAGLAELPGLLVFLESPRRAAAALADLAELWGHRRAVVAREMTKVHEEFARGTLGELAQRFSPGPLRGEVTLVVEGAAGGTAAGARPARAARGGVIPLKELAVLRREVDRLMREAGAGRSAAVRAAARARGVDPRELYRALAAIPRRGGASEESE
jgi:16S rRNA (cytidine1402-2'-O)-methyltransferase